MTTCESIAQYIISGYSDPGIISEYSNIKSCSGAPVCTGEIGCCCWDQLPDYCFLTGMCPQLHEPEKIKL